MLRNQATTKNFQVVDSEDAAAANLTALVGGKYLYVAPFLRIDRRNCFGNSLSFMKFRIVKAILDEIFVYQTGFCYFCGRKAGVPSGAPRRTLNQYAINPYITHNIIYRYI